MALLPAHQRLPEDDTDEELTPEQIEELLVEAEASLRAKQAASRSSDSPFKLPKLHVDTAKLTATTEQKPRPDGPKKIEDPVLIRAQKQEEKKAHAGSQWFNMPRTEVTPELRRDLQLLKMRSVLDPKRHYKKMNSKSDVPAFSQVGTIIEGPTEYYTGRIQNKDRKTTFVDEVLSQEAANGRFKNKYNAIQKGKASGKKGFYKALKAKRQGKR